jgi:hypothetical protein
MVDVGADPILLQTLLSRDERWQDFKRYAQDTFEQVAELMLRQLLGQLDIE